MKSLVLFGADGVAEGVAEDGINLDRTRWRCWIHIFGRHDDGNTEAVIPVISVSEMVIQCQLLFVRSTGIAPDAMQSAGGFK